MQRFQREKDLEESSKQKRSDKHLYKHKSKKSRYHGEIYEDESEIHRSHDRHHRKRESRSFKNEYSKEPSKKSKKSRHSHSKSDNEQDKEIITENIENIEIPTTINDPLNMERFQDDEYNTIEINIRDEEDAVEEGELEGDTKEEDYINPYKMSKSKFDEDDEEEEDEEEEEEEPDIKLPNSHADSARKSDASIERSAREEGQNDNIIENDEEEEDEEETDTKKHEDTAKDTKAPTPPSPLTPKDAQDVNSPSLNLPPFFPAIQGCRNVEEFHCLNRVEEGTYGVVYRAVDRKTQEIVALKRLKMEKENEGFPITSLREINTLLICTHENVVKIREVVVGSNMDKIYLVMDFVEHDLKSLMEYMKEPFLIGEVKTLMLQLLSGVAHLHDNWVVHRDLKTSNLLLSNQGILKIGDFGLAREYGSPLKPYTPIVVTLWYRAPELLLGQKIYSTPIDLWSVGCIYGELVLKKPLFPGRSELDQINRIFKELGTPNEKIWPGVTQLSGYKTLSMTEHLYNKLAHKFDKKMSARGFELMNVLLTYNPEKRITAEEALKHPFFNEVPIPVDPSMFPTWPSKSELRMGKVKIGRTPKAPSGGEAFAKMAAEEEVVSTGFQLKTTQKTSGFNLRF